MIDCIRLYKTTGGHAMNKNFTLRLVIPLNNDEEDVIDFTGKSGLPMEIHHAEVWSKNNGYKLVRSPAKIDKFFPDCHQEAIDDHMKIYYAIR